MIIQYPLGQLQANCYFVIQDNKCLIIDPADEASFIHEELQRKKLKPVAMFATHGHFDHVMAAGEIQLSLDIPLYIFKEDKFLLDRLAETAEHFLGHNPVITKPKNIKYLSEGNLKIADYGLRIIHTPGHTPGSACFYFKSEKILFTGDTLFKQAIGRTDLSYSSGEELQNSLKKIFKLPVGTKVYSGHEEVTSIGQEAQFFHF